MFLEVSKEGSQRGDSSCSEKVTPHSSEAATFKIFAMQHCYVSSELQQISDVAFECLKHTGAEIGKRICSGYHIEQTLVKDKQSIGGPQKSSMIHFGGLKFVIVQIVSIPESSSGSQGYGADVRNSNGVL